MLSFLKAGAILRDLKDASVLELVDKGDSKSPAFGRGGSSPPAGTIFFLPSQFLHPILTKCIKSRGVYF